MTKTNKIVFQVVASGLVCYVCGQVVDYHCAAPRPGDGSFVKEGMAKLKAPSPKKPSAKSHPQHERRLVQTLWVNWEFVLSGDTFVRRDSSVFTAAPRGPPQV